jgi:hypothetical protein
MDTTPTLSRILHVHGRVVLVLGGHISTPPRQCHDKLADFGYGVVSDVSPRAVLQYVVIVTKRVNLLFAVAIRMRSAKTNAIIMMIWS